VALKVTPTSPPGRVPEIFKLLLDGFAWGSIAAEMAAKLFNEKAMSKAKKKREMVEENGRKCSDRLEAWRSRAGEKASDNI
jgi:hypothetical protein